MAPLLQGIKKQFKSSLRLVNWPWRLIGYHLLQAKIDPRLDTVDLETDIPECI